MRASALAIFGNEVNSMAIPGVEREAIKAGEYGAREARIDLAAAHRLADRDGLGEGTWNHLSLVVPEDPTYMLVSPANVHWSLVTASNLTVLGPDAAPIEAEAGPDWTTYCLHYPIHKARPDATCVLHLHPLYTTALSMLKNGRLEMAHQNAMMFWGRLAYNETYDGEQPLSLAVGQEMAEVLGDKSVLFLKNHGVLIVGPTVGAAYRDAYLLERACQMQFIALSSGSDLEIVSPRVCKLLAPHGVKEDRIDGYFEGMKRVLDKECPDYAQ
jgi:ribulose-5-phosphate 4-epimerase/fuculose-1-phosphate aldolase